MGFLSPLMLFGALAAAIPVAIHLFFRSRYRTVPWAAMKFLLTSVEQTSRRLKFQELLLLLLRMAVLVMLALAFARPISSVVRGGGRGDAVDAVFVIDTSYSMGAQDGAKTRLQRAQEQAITIIDELPAHSTVQIVTCAGKTKTKIGPRQPGNLDQAKLLVQNLEIAHLATDLFVGVEAGQEVLKTGQASNKEFYVFSDMQQTGFQQQPGKLRSTLAEIKEKAVVHLVRCGTRSVKNAAVVGIAPHDVARPNSRSAFAVLVRNTGDEALENVDVTLAVDGDSKKYGGTERIVKLAKGETAAITLTGMFAKAGLHVLTATIHHDELDGDNRYDQVILVRNQVNILIVDGHFDERKPEESSSYFLAHSLVPVAEGERSLYKYNPRVVSSRLATAALLKDQEICILVNCALQPKVGADALEKGFIEALDPFVRAGHGLVIMSGDNVQPELYNQVLGKKLGLLPMPLKNLITPGEMPSFINRTTFGQGPPAYWNFKDERRYAVFDAVEVRRYFDLDESGIAAPPVKQAPAGNADKAKELAAADEENPVQVIVRLDTNKPLVVAKKVEAGEVIFIATAAQADGVEPKTEIPRWTQFHKLPVYVPFLDVTIAHLMHVQTQSYNRVAGETFTYSPKDNRDHAYYLLHPDRKTIDRLGLPERHGKNFVVTASDLPRAGIYYLTSLPRGSDAGDAINPDAAMKSGTPIAVIPDLEESKNLATLSDAEIDTQLGFTPIHIIAGETASTSATADRLNREWTVWALMAVLVLVLFEVVLAWWCGRAW